MPFTVTTTADTVTLTSPVDPSYGIRVRRVISLDAEKAILHVATTYEKVEGNAIKVSVWTITQLNSPERGFVLLPKSEKIPGGYIKPVRTGPNDPYPFETVSIRGRLLSFTRDPKIKRKLGSDGDRMLWVGKTQSLLVEQKASGNAGLFYPDNSHSQIYTNPDELPYVEFELLAPLRNMQAGDSATLHATYILQTRTSNDDFTEARHIFQLKAKD